MYQMFKAITLSVLVVVVVLLGNNSANALTGGPSSGGLPISTSGICNNFLSESLQNPIMFDKMCYTQSETAILGIWDQSIPRTQLSITAKIVSENDQKGITIQLFRSVTNLNVFTAVVRFSNNLPSYAPSNQIHVMPGNFVYAIYKDEVDARTLVYDGNKIMFDSQKYVGNYYGRVLLIVPPISTSGTAPAVGVPTAMIHLSSLSDTNGIDVILHPIEVGSQIYSSDSLIQFFTQTSTQNGAIAIKVDPASHGGADTVTASAESSSGKISTTAQIGTENTIAAGEGPGGGNLPTFGQGTPQFTANCANFGGDTDGDGLCNNWEQTDGSLRVAISNPASTFVFPVCSSTITPPNCTGGTGSLQNPWSPQKFSKYTKDVAIQFDYYTPNAPDKTALIHVIGNFTAHGVNLHIQNGTQITNILPTTGGPWTLKDGSSITSTSLIQFPDDFNTIRANFFASHDTANGNSNPKIAKSQVFHYGLNTYQMKDATGAPLTTSGYSEEPGNDFITSIWNWPGILNTQSTSGIVPSTNIQEATFMHELGHNFNLRHGGSDYNNCKPNYISVMNYLYTYQSEVPLVSPEKYVLDYSNYAGFNSLNEANLDESHGLGNAQSNSQYAVIGSNNASMAYLVVPLSTTGGNPINFDRIGSTDNTNTGVDLDLFSFADCWGSSNGASSGGHAADTLNPSNDWSNMVYNFRTSSTFNTDPIMTVSNGTNGLNEMTLSSFKSAIIAGLNYTQNKLLSGTSGNNTVIVNNAFEQARGYVADGNIDNATTILNDAIGNNFDNVITNDSHHSLHDLYQGEIDALRTAIPMQFNSNTSQTNNQPQPITLDRPLIQVKNGVLPENVQCNTGLSLILKASDGSPACVKPTTKQILISAGWGTNVSYGKNQSLTQTP